MPLPKRVENGYRGVEIRRTEVHGFFVVIMSNNRWRFSDMGEARAFVDYQISRGSY